MACIGGQLQERAAGLVADAQYNNAHMQAFEHPNLLEVHDGVVAIGVRLRPLEEISLCIKLSTRLKLYLVAL